MDDAGQPRKGVSYETQSCQGVLRGAEDAIFAHTSGVAPSASTLVGHVGRGDEEEQEDMEEVTAMNPETGET